MAVTGMGSTSTSTTAESNHPAQGPSGWTGSGPQGAGAMANQDIEQQHEAGAEAHLKNSTVRQFSWHNVSVTVKDRETKLPKTIVDSVEGMVQAGEMCALMGPSGCGKTTLLNVLASRPTGAPKVERTVLVNGTKTSKAAFRKLSCFVEQEDALIGSLTVRETLNFAARLANTRALSKQERMARIDGLLSSFGLTDQAQTLIGTPLRKGISGGQKRRLGVASQLITSPKILFLDEPTSGLDSAASWEVIRYLQRVTKRYGVSVPLCLVPFFIFSLLVFSLLIFSLGPKRCASRMDG
jgi:ABC-type lipoprotein export system ATPase subunit